MSENSVRKLARLAFTAGAAALALGSLGCGAGKQKKDEPSAVVYNKEKMHCERVYPTGSHIPVLRCVDRNHADTRREQDQRRIQDLQQGGSIVNSPRQGGGGGN